MSRRLLLPASFLLTALGLAIFVSGGVATTIIGIRVSARSPWPSLVTAAVLLATWVVAARGAKAIGPDLSAADRWLVSRSPAIVWTIALLAASTATVFNSFSAAGSDPSGYLSEAKMLSRREITRQEPLSPIADWPSAPATLAPLGWMVSSVPGMQVPTYPVGLPILLAPAHALGGPIAASLVVPLSFALAIWAVGALALRLAGAYASIFAATWFATSPVALIESMQVMTDVPVAAAWMLCWALAVREKSAAAGVAAAIAVLIRPNLAPLAAVPALYLRRTGVIAFAVPVALAAAVIASFHWRWYGSPLRSGYGTAAELFALGNVAPNATLYTRWLIDTHGPWLVLAPVALVWPKIRAMRWLLMFAALVVAAYLVFAVFEVWTYLRFLLPALAVGMVAVSGMVAAMLGRIPKGPHPIGLALVLLALAATNVANAREHGVFRFADQQARARVVGEQLATMLPDKAVIVSGEQSGAMRYYTDRSIVRWDIAGSGALDVAIERLQERGYVVWLVLDDWEEQPFRRKFPAVSTMVLDYPPSVESAAGVGIRTRAWRVR